MHCLCTWELVQLLLQIVSNSSKGATQIPDDPVTPFLESHMPKRCRKYSYFHIKNTCVLSSQKVKRKIGAVHPGGRVSNHDKDTCMSVHLGNKWSGRRQRIVRFHLSAVSRVGRSVKTVDEVACCCRLEGSREQVLMRMNGFHSRLWKWWQMHNRTKTNNGLCKGGGCVLWILLLWTTGHGQEMRARGSYEGVGSC